MKKLIIFAILSISVLAACKKDPPSPAENTTNKLIGKWNLNSTGDAYPLGSPEVKTMYNNTSYDFKGNGVMILILNGSQPMEYSWKMLDATTLNYKDANGIIDNTFTVVSLTATELTLSKSDFKNGSQGETRYYFTKVPAP